MSIPSAHKNSSRSPISIEPRTAANIARQRGWGVGTRLVGTDDFGTTVIEITAIGRFLLLASRVDEDGRLHPTESTWHLDARDWKVASRE